MNKLRLIKTIVVLMTLLLVFGLLSALGLLFQKTKRHTLPPEQQIVSLNEPFGSTITQTQINDNLLYLTIKNGGVSDRIVVFDTTSGQQILKLTIN